MLTPDQILALAPDAGSAKAAQGLLGPAKWSHLGGREGGSEGGPGGALWGACQGSGANPYVVGIDLSGPAFTCSCPSRKFPCKHGLALFLLRAARADLFTGTEAPEKIGQWLAGRQSRAEKAAEKQAEKVAEQAERAHQQAAPAGAAPSPAVSEEGAAAAAASPEEGPSKAEVRRLERIQAGAEDLSRWLADRVRQGLSLLPGSDEGLWHTAAARLVDAQAPGLAQRLRDLDGVVHSGAGFAERTLVHLGTLQLLADALGRYAELPPPVQADLRTACGWPLDRASAAADAVSDRWWVRGVVVEAGERLFERRVWLTGEHTGRTALILDFAFGGPRFEVPFVPGTWVEATLGFFPSGDPLRALALTPPALVPGVAEAPVGPQAPRPAADAPGWAEALAGVANRLAGNPWAQRLPLGLRAVVPVRRGEDAWGARDPRGVEVPLALSDAGGWGLLAVSGGEPVRLFGEWSEGRLRPLQAWATGAEAPHPGLIGPGGGPGGGPEAAPLWTAEREV